MTVVRRLPFLVVLTVLAAAGSAFASASNIYITPNGNPAGNCTSNVQTPAFFNNASNWGSGSNQIGPGTTVQICGTFTGAAGATEFSFHGSGTNGNPVTLLFDNGTQLTAPYWSSNGAINCTNLSYIVVNGGTNGAIRNTANGTALTYQQASAGFSAGGCTNSEVKNLTISNIYMNQGSSSSAGDTGGLNTQGIVFNGNSTSSIADNNTVSDAKTGIMFCGDPNGDASNIQIYGNKISDIDWGINVGGGDSGDTFNSISIHDNTITNWTNWQFPTNTYHQDGIILFNFATGSATLTASVYSNYIYGDLGVGSPTGFIYCAQNVSCTLYNNVLTNTGHVIYGIIWLDTHLGGSKVFNNVIVGNTVNDFAFTLGTSTGTNVSSPLTFENNIATGVGVGIHDYSTLTSDVSVSNYNVWRNSSGAAPQMATGDSNYISYTSWQSDGFDSGSTNGNPLLDSSFQLQSGSSAIGLGANLQNLSNSSLDLDKNLNPRPGTPGGPGTASTHWDAGAYNYGASNVQPPTGLSAVVQ